MAVITDYIVNYTQHVNYMFWPILFWPASVWIQLSEKTTQYNMIPTLMVILYHVIFCVVFSDNYIQPDYGQKYCWPKHVVDLLYIIDNVVVL